MDEIQKRFQDELSRFPDPVDFALNFPTQINYELARIKTTEQANGLRALSQMGLKYMQQMLPKIVRDRRRKHKLMAPTEKAYVEVSAAAGIMWSEAEDKATQGTGMQKRSANLPNIRSVIDAGFRDSRDATRCVRAGDLHPEDRRIYYEERIDDGVHITLPGVESIWNTLYGEVMTTGTLLENEGVKFGFWALPRPLTEGWGSGDTWKRMCAELEDTPDVAFGKTDQIPGNVLAVDHKTGYEWATLPFKESQFKFGYWDPPYDHLYKKEGIEIWRTCQKIAILHTHIYPRSWFANALREGMYAITMGPMKQTRCLQVFRKANV